MAEPKTRPTGASVTAFLDAVESSRRRTEGFELLELFTRVTGAPAQMWGPSIVGFGSVVLRNTTGEAEWPIVGFSPRKAALTLYGLHDDLDPRETLLAELGPHTLSRACLYLKHLDLVDAAVPERLVARAWARYAGR